MDKSPMSRLPRELRDMVYVLAFDNDGTEIKLNYRNHILSLAGSQKLGLALLKTCKQIRSEINEIGGTKMFYAQNYFHITCNTGSAIIYNKVMRAILDSMGEDNVKAVRSFTLNPIDTTGYDAQAAVSSAIVHLHSFCLRNEMPLKLTINQHDIKAVLDMLHLRTSCTRAADEMVELGAVEDPVLNAAAHRWEALWLEEACERAMMEAEKDGHGY